MLPAPAVIPHPHVSHVPPLNVAVFASGADLVLVDLAKDSDGFEAASAAARGYAFIGSIGVNDGEPKVQCETGAYATSMMPFAGVVFARMLGKHLQAYQVQQSGKA